MLFAGINVPTEILVEFNMLQKLPVIKNLSRTQRAIAVTVSLIVVYELVGYAPLTFLFPDTHFSNVGPDFKFTNHFSLFLLGFMPAITGFFLVEVCSFFLPPLKTWRINGKRGRSQLTKWSLIVSLILATLHASTLIHSFPGRILPNGQHLLEDPSLFHQGLLVFVVVLGFVMLCGLAELITRYGIGNGFAVIIGYGIMFSIPQSVVDLFTDDLKIENLSLGRKNIMTGEPPNLVGILLFIFLLAVLYKKFWRGVPLPVLYKKFWKSVPVLFKRAHPPLLKTKAKRKSVDFQLPYLPQGVFTFLWPYSIIMYFAFQLSFGSEWSTKWFDYSVWTYWLIYAVLLVATSYLGYFLVSHPDRIAHNTFGKINFREGWERKVDWNAIRSIIIVTLLWFLWNAPLAIYAGESVLFGSLGLVSIITIAAILKDVFDQYRFLQNVENPRVLETFDNVHYVTVLKGLFEAEGIRFCVQAFEYRRLFYFFEPLIKMRILVDARDWEKANELADLENVTII
jgi:preprotein translocase subunit SecY